MKSTHRRPVRSAAPVTRKVSTRTSVYGRTSVFTVAWSWTATITLRSTFLTEGSDGAYANLHPRVRSGVLLREAPRIYAWGVVTMETCVQAHGVSTYH